MAEQLRNPGNGYHPDRAAWPQCEGETRHRQRCSNRAFWRVLLGNRRIWLCGVHCRGRRLVPVERADRRPLEAPFV